MPDTNKPTDKSPRILSHKLGADWKVLSPTDQPENVAEFQCRQRVLSDIILSPHLVVICGLGVSVYVKDDKGTSLAPTMAELWKDISEDSAFEEIVKHTSFPKTDQNIERFLSHCQLWNAVSPSQQIAEFVRRAEDLIVTNCRFVTPGVVLDKHEIFLRKVARRSTRLARMKLFTTNYDRSFEVAASRMGFIVVDGFSHTSQQEFDGSNFDYDFVRRNDEKEGPEYLPNVFHLLKMHGSVDWELRDGRIVRSDYPERPLIIYPRNTKFESSYNPPFIEMMSRVQIELRQPNVGLLIIGFGFNDEHIAQPILAAVRSNVGLKAAIVDPCISQLAHTNAHLGAIAQLIRSGDDRLSLIESTFEETVQSLPDLVSVTEEEQHHRRLNDALQRK